MDKTKTDDARKHKRDGMSSGDGASWNEERFWWYISKYMYMSMRRCDARL